MYSTFYSYGMAICQRYCDNNQDASEILNQGFLEIFKKINHYKLVHSNLPGAFKGWLRDVMIECSIDFYRKNFKSQRVVEFNEGTYPLLDTSDNNNDQFSHGNILEAVRELSPFYRVVYNLYVIEGLSHEVIAEKLSTTIDNTQLNLWRARKQLENILLARRTLSKDIIS